MLKRSDAAKDAATWRDGTWGQMDERPGLAPRPGLRLPPPRSITPRSRILSGIAALQHGRPLCHMFRMCRASAGHVPAVDAAGPARG